MICLFKSEELFFKDIKNVEQLSEEKKELLKGYDGQLVIGLKL